IMAAATGIMMSLTHYATGSAPVIYCSNYVTMTEWWKAGFIMSVLEILIFGTVGILWWKVLGYW
ncbi:MAG: anion permease, partial [Neisseria subflava]|nr:anion permease [Neisseria subflava]